MMSGKVPAQRTRPYEPLGVQLVLELVAGVLLPSTLFLRYFGQDSNAAYGVYYSIIGATLAIGVSTILIRRVTAFPGVRAFKYVLPSYASSYALVLLAMFATRANYNRLFLVASFLLAVLVAVAINAALARGLRRRIYLVPHGQVEPAANTPEIEWIVMDAPVLPPDHRDVIAADLRHDQPDDWQRFLALAAVRGHPVYHTKLLQESLTGRVSIEHLSENSFGSLLPNLAYVKGKRLIDIVASLLLLPVLLVPLAVLALAIRLDSRGGVFFVQRRVGYRGIPFSMVKFRTMHAADEPAVAEERLAAMTAHADPRITRLGRVLRRTRLDELPQIVNVLRGEMSWIGPRPEAVQLSGWYDAEIPFYYYRHIVRPGISGWAQVHQGHVTDLHAVSTKLDYDFYYIKNFSLWIDVLIAFKTVRTIVSGFGAR